MNKLQLEESRRGDAAHHSGCVRLLRKLENACKRSIHVGTGFLAMALVVAIGGSAFGEVLTFQQGVGGYAGNEDAQLRQAGPDWDSSTTPYIYVYSTFHGLTRFHDIFGAGPNQVPVGSTIIGATLDFVLFEDNNAGLIDLHRMVADWVDTDTWNTMVNGIQRDGVEALVTATVVGGGSTFDVTADVQAWAAGTPNRGWSMHLNASSPTNWYGYCADYSQSAKRPVLTVEYDPTPIAAEQATWGEMKTLFR